MPSSFYCPALPHRNLLLLMLMLSYWPFSHLLRGEGPHLPNHRLESLVFADIFFAAPANQTTAAAEGREKYNTGTRGDEGSLCFISRMLE